MKVQGLNHNEFLNFQIQRNFISQCKEFLVVLEDFKLDGFLTEEGYSRLRSKFLGSTNDRIRDLQETLSQFTVELNKQ